VPESVRPLDAVRRTAELMNVLAGSVRVVRAIASRRGELAERIPTALGPMCAMVVQAAPGTTIDIEDVTEEGASAWGRALAGFHAAAAGIAWPAEQRFAVALPDGPDRFGLIHGDFELDNLAWEAGVPTAFDLDEATRSWYAADVAYALRDADGRPGIVAAFLAGYRSVRRFGAADEESLPVFRRLHAARSADAVAALLAADSSPEDHPSLSDKLQRYVQAQRAIADGSVTAPD